VSNVLHNVSNASAFGCRTDFGSVKHTNEEKTVVTAEYSDAASFMTSFKENNDPSAFLIRDAVFTGNFCRNGRHCPFPLGVFIRVHPEIDGAPIQPDVS
jgi:hypothetical protein